MDQQTAHRILSGGGGAGGAVLRAALAAASVPYGLLLRARRWAHRGRLIPGDSLARYSRPGSGRAIRVISVGNITTGGTGKTPMVAWVARRLHSMGLRPGVLLRGYKGAGGDSDEARLLRELCGDCPVVANPDRLAGAMDAMAAGAEAMILDDGFQHLRLRRDLDIVLIDATNPFGYGWCLPRGLLREPAAALRHAHEIVITRSDAVDEAALAALRGRLERLAPQAGIRLAVHRATGFRVGRDGSHRAASEIAGSAGGSPPSGCRVFAFCGIGNPGAFFATLEGLGAKIAGRLALNDHAAYTPEVLARVRHAASESGADLLATTRKDGVKIGETDLGLPLWQLEIEMHVTEGEAALIEGLRRACMGKGTSN
jgi:tetraacyldisaccharide 4'-kinase